MDFDNQLDLKKNTLSDNNKNKSVLWLLGFAIGTIVLWQVPGGNFILYPFTILGTWFHEMGHGITAIFLGGDFLRLELYPDGSGLTTHTGDLFFGRIGRGIVAAAGPLGPTFIGGLFIYAATNEKLTKIILTLFSIMLAISIIFWIRPLFGFGTGIILLFSIFIIFISLKASPSLKRFTLQFLGIQSLVSLYLSIGYLFSDGGAIEGKNYYSDTMVMQQHLLLPYWFWGAAILVFSAFIIYKSLSYAYKGKKQAKST